MTSKLRDGIIKRGSTFSYVVRVSDPETGLTRPTWVGGFESESAAKAARDNARVAVRRGEFVDRATVTVRAYLHDWLDGHAGSVKPKTLAGYRHDVEHYIAPRIGGQRLQALRPAVISKLYRDLSTNGGRGDRALSPRTVDHVHRTLRKALNDAVTVERLIPSNPCRTRQAPACGPARGWLGLDPGAARSVPGSGLTAPPVRLLPAGRIHGGETR